MEVKFEGLEDLEVAFRDYWPILKEEAHKVIEDVVEEAADVVRNNTPVVTGKTKASIDTTHRPGSGVVHATGEAISYIDEVEEKHGMFQAGREFVENELDDRMQEALNYTLDRAGFRG